MQIETGSQSALGGLVGADASAINEGRKRAKARRQSLGRPFKLTPHQQQEATKRRDRREEREVA